jgi:hypothetical protein
VSVQPLDQSTKKAFLTEDLYDALRWLFVSAVAWAASRNQPHRCGNQDVLAMFSSLVQARALYEFFYVNGRQHDDARACDFTSDPVWRPPETNLYRTYMASHKPANKRTFHLVYNRSVHSGGSGPDGADHLKNQVLEFAKDLRSLVEQFMNSADAAFRDNIRRALDEALREAKLTADLYGIPNPL